MDGQQEAHQVAQQQGAGVEETRRLLATIAGLRQKLERVTQERDDRQAALQKIADEHLPYVERLGAENARLVEFAQEMCRVGFDGGSLDGCDILDTAVKHGLCRITEYHSGMTGITNAEYFEEGDAVYVFDGPLFRAMQEPHE